MIKYWSVSHASWLPPSKRTLSKNWSLIRSESGQAAIFIALIFQVLFVFFAMVINVGLVVHDKINLQNSVDLAAYYAAGKQAEMLNVIAHSNYQLRQSWKLLSWRIRVLGDAGRKTHPITNPTVPPKELDINIFEGSQAGQGRRPAVCLGNYLWTVTEKNPGQSPENLCSSEAVYIQKLQDVPVIASFLTFNQAVSQFAKEQQAVFGQGCNAAGVESWRMAAIWFVSYRFDISQRKQFLRAFATELSKSTQDFSDPSGQSVLAGARETLRHNLTRSNSSAVKDADIEMLNGLGYANGDYKKWLHEMFVYPKIIFSDFSNASGSCVGEQKVMTNGTAEPNRLPSVFFSNPAKREQYDPKKLLSSSVVTDMAPESLTESQTLTTPSVGYEKNPWYMPYVGIKATLQTRKPFSPFGKPITITARAFAKPFGGMIGPWMFREWNSGSLKSNAGALVDELLPAVADDNPQATAKQFQVPNYARFPGDKLGLQSLSALAAMRGIFNSNLGHKFWVSSAFWGYLPANADSPTGDPLAWTNMNTIKSDLFYKTNMNFAQQNPWIRSAEIAALAPDMFDIMYYSIQPEFYQLYGTQAASLLGEVTKPRADLGTHDGDPLFQNLNVRSQVESFGARPDIYSAATNWIVRDSSHLLTSWLPSGAYNYSPNPPYFMNCLKTGDRSKYQVPGACAAGGRSGYSVKIVSKKYLDSPGHKLGGRPDTAGPIANAPKNF